MAELNVPARKRKRSQGPMLKAYGLGLGKGTVQAHRFQASVKHPTAGVFRVRKHVSDQWFESYLLSVETEGRPKGLFLLLGLEDEDEPYWIAFDDRFVCTNWGEEGWVGADQSEEQKAQLDAWRQGKPLYGTQVESEFYCSCVCRAGRRPLKRREGQAQALVRVTVVD